MQMKATARETRDVTEPYTLFLTIAYWEKIKPAVLLVFKVQ
nr:hypothetical protein [Escherichia albertii]